MGTPLNGPAAGDAAGTVTVVGAGVAGAACAVALRAAGVPVRVVERGRAPGGRMASPEVHGRRVDLGAGYFTVRDDEFATVVAGWEAAGLARPWTDTFSVLSPDEEPTTKSGPVRWATPGGLRTLVRDLLTAAEVDVEYEVAVDSLPDGPTVLAMPDPQAQQVFAAPEVRFVDYDPVIAVAVGYETRGWDGLLHDAAFVSDHPDVSFVADDGSRRGDGAAVLVAHTTPERARRHLVRPEDAAAPVVDALSGLLGLPEPAWTHVHRWTFAKPAESHDASFLLHTAGATPVGLAGDQWCPQGSPRVESAWRSGTDLGRALAAAL